MRVKGCASNRGGAVMLQIAGLRLYGIQESAVHVEDVDAISIGPSGEVDENQYVFNKIEPM